MAHGGREEIEAKFPIAGRRSLQTLRARMRELGFVVAKPSRRESNWIFDTPKSDLRRSGRLLRLRQSGGEWLLTVKGVQRSGALKRRAEEETTVADGKACRQLLELLGYGAVLCYRRARTTFTHPQQVGEIALDQTPMGWYVEIEGAAKWIRSTAAGLGLDLNGAEPRSYPELYRKAGKAVELIGAGSRAALPQVGLTRRRDGDS